MCSAKAKSSDPVLFLLGSQTRPIKASRLRERSDPARIERGMVGWWTAGSVVLEDKDDDGDFLSMQSVRSTSAWQW